MMYARLREIEPTYKKPLKQLITSYEKALSFRKRSWHTVTKRAVAALAATALLYMASTNIKTPIATETTTIAATTDVPEQQIILPPIGAAPYTLHIQKDTNTSLLIDSTGRTLRTYRHTDAKDPRPKTRQHQKRTPEGIYRIDRHHLNPQGRTHELYGRGFLRINYPTEQQKQEGYTGGGVLICSAANDVIRQAIERGQDVMNVGVAYTTTDFEHLYRTIGESLEETQIIIEDSTRPLD